MKYFAVYDKDGDMVTDIGFRDSDVPGDALLEKLDLLGVGDWLIVSGLQYIREENRGGLGGA